MGPTSAVIPGPTNADTDIGGYVFAGEINAMPNDLEKALRRYDATLRPFVDQIQAAVKPRLLALGLPKPKIAVAALQLAFKVACARRIPERIASRAKTDRGGLWNLPHYEGAAATHEA